MKAEIKKAEVKFEPIKLEIIIENEKDLCELWHRFNVGDYCLQGKVTYSPSAVLTHKVQHTSTQTWKLLDELVEKNNLKIEF